MNSKIKKAMEAILKSYFEGEVIFEESEIAEVIDAATNDGAVEMMDRSMDYVYRTVVKVNDVFVTQIGFRELSTLGLTLHHSLPITVKALLRKYKHIISHL